MRPCARASLPEAPAHELPLARKGAPMLHTTNRTLLSIRPATRLTCVWLRTTDPHAPLTCVWQRARTPNSAAPSSE
jgi:hypothetical protein